MARTPLHEQSHGQSFLSLAANRFGPDSLYVLDEPDTVRLMRGFLDAPERSSPRRA